MPENGLSGTGRLIQDICYYIQVIRRRVLKLTGNVAPAKTLTSGHIRDLPAIITGSGCLGLKGQMSKHDRCVAFLLMKSGSGAAKTARQAAIKNDRGWKM